MEAHVAGPQTAPAHMRGVGHPQAKQALHTLRIIAWGVGCERWGRGNGGVHPFDMYSSIRLRRAKVGREKPTYFYLDWTTDYPLIRHDLWLW